MKRRVYQGAILMALACLYVTAAQGVEVVLVNPAWSKLSQQERERIEAQLRTAGLLGTKDKIVSVDVTVPGVQETDVGLAHILREICIAKHVAELVSCTKLPRNERTPCQQSENARHEKAIAACN